MQALCVTVRADPPLALAVVTVAAGLEDARRAEPVDRSLQVGTRIDPFIGGRVTPKAFDEALLVEPVLRRFERAGVRKDALFRHGFGSGDGDVLEFPCHHIALRGKGGERGAIVPLVREDIVANLAHHIIAFGRIGDAAIAQLRGAHRHHPAELAAAQDPDGTAALQHQSTGRSVTAALRAARQSCRRCERAAS